MTHHLSKSRFVAGWTCPRYLWWKVHEPDAPEFQLDVPGQDLVDQGNDVGFLATQRFSGGTLVDLPYEDMHGKVEATRKALQDEGPAIFEASFMEGDVFVAVDVLERLDVGFRLIEVKASNDVKEKYIADAAIQTYVVRRAGLDVRHVILMHLNKEYRHPDQGDLFMLDDITDDVESFLPDVPGMIAEQLNVIAGPDPGDCFGERCAKGDGCPFVGRCWPQAQDHVLRLHGVGIRRALALMADGIEVFEDVDDGVQLGAPARRQLESWRTGKMVLEPGLAAALGPFQGRVGFLDFETVARAVPVWDGLAPWGGAPVQFSYHERAADGSITHTDWLAEGPGDPRPELAAALVEATGGAEHVAMYTSFERTQIQRLQAAVPDLARDLAALEGKLVDLQLVVKDHVYHPAFGGSFSIKQVLPALVPGLSYAGMPVHDGQQASVELAHLLLRSDQSSAEEREAKRAQLLEYCGLDTLAMVRLVEKLEELARAEV